MSGVSGATAVREDREHRPAGPPPRPRAVALLLAVGLVLLLLVLLDALAQGSGDGGRGSGDEEEQVEAQDDGPQGPQVDPRDLLEDPPVSADPRLTWAPPQLEDPETVRVTPDELRLELDDGQDYVVELPDEPLVVDDDLEINGGDDVVLVGGRIEAPDGERALFLVDQTGTVHVEGLSIGGEGLEEAINLDQREGGVVQLQNVVVDAVDGSYEGNHGDLLQTWAGPRELRIDGFRARTGYQGFFLLPHQHADDVEVAAFDFRRVALSGTEDAAFLLWTEKDPDYEVRAQDVVVAHDGDRDEERDEVLRRLSTWRDVRVGDPTEVEMPGGTPGVGYRSPGYLPAP